VAEIDRLCTAEEHGDEGGKEEEGTYNGADFARGDTLMEIVIVVVSVLATVISIPAGAYYLWERYKDRDPDYEKSDARRAPLSWTKVTHGATETIRRLRSDNWLPDLVLGIGRSGAIYGGLIAGNMNNLPLAILDRHLVWDRNSRQYLADHHSRIELPTECRKILVVVGEVYSGQSLTASLEKMESALKDRAVRTACLVRSMHSDVKVDYAIYEVDRAVRPAWILGSDYKRFELLPKSDASAAEQSKQQEEAE
jgi:hypoxanthine phosphoribosyltransferase